MVPVYARLITARSVAKTGRPIATAVMQSARKYANGNKKKINKKIKKKEKGLKHKTKKKTKHIVSTLNHHDIIHNSFMTEAKRLNARASVLVERRRPVIDA